MVSEYEAEKAQAESVIETAVLPPVRSTASDETARSWFQALRDR